MSSPDPSIKTPTLLPENSGKAELFIKIHRELDKLEDMILDSSPRIMGKTLVNEEKLCEQIDEARMSVPESIAQAEEILFYKQDIVTEAEQRAQEILGVAEAKIVKAEQRSQEILGAAEAKMVKAEQRSQEILGSAESRIRKLIEETGIVRQAEAEASQVRRQTQQECEVLKSQTVQELNQMRRQTQQECEALKAQTLQEVNQIRKQSQQEWEILQKEESAELASIQKAADEYSDRMLGGLEGQLIEMIRIVQNGRKHVQVSTKSDRKK